MTSRAFRSPAFRVFLLGCFLAAGGVWPIVWGPATAHAQAGLETKPVGKVQKLTGSATIEHTKAVVVQANLSATGAAQAKVEDPIYQGDIIQTGPDGTLGIIFGDGTSFNISKNARMEINEFVYDPKGKSNSTLINLTKGTFTFLAGKTATNGNMRVETPVGTMGIRGTAPHVEILEDGTVKFTTLVEENKKADAKPSAQPQKPLPAYKPLPRLDICRNC